MSRITSMPAWLRWPLAVLSVILGFTIAGRVSDTPLTGSFTFNTALGFTIPVVLAGLAGIVSERAGVVNVGIEGMMILGTWGAGFLGWKWGAWGVLIGGAIGGLLGGLLHALSCVTFGVNQTVSGVAINLLAPGVTRYLSGEFFANNGGSISDSPAVGAFSRFNTPFIAGGSIFGWKTPDIAGNLEFRNWFFISDVAAVLKGFFGDVSWSTFLLLLLVPGVWYLLWRTPWGLRMRSIGEKPTAAESLGVKVAQVKWAALALSGSLAGLGGSWLVMNNLKFQQGQVAGRGFLGLAAVIIGNWQPFVMMLGAFLFCLAQAVAIGISNEAKGLLVAAGAALAMLGVSRIINAFRTGERTNGLIISSALMIVLGAAVAIGSVNAETINVQLVYSLPYVLTLFVLWFASTRQRPPASAGIPWRKGQVN
jgi:general nucleoside transport system permease protein